MGISQRRVWKSDTGKTGSVEVEIWEIVDVRELPEVEARMRQGLFQSARSLRSHSTKIDAPLLIYQPHRIPQTLFVPAQCTSVEEDASDRKRLASTLLEQMDQTGEPWEDDDLALANVEQVYLPLFLAEDNDVRALAHKLQLLLKNDDADYVSHVIDENPELLSDEALRALDLLESAPPEGTERPLWEATINQHRDALVRLRADRAAIATPALFFAVRAAHEALSRYQVFQRLDDLEEAVRWTRNIAAIPDLAEAAPSFQEQAFRTTAGTSLALFARHGQAEDLIAAHEWVDRARNLFKDDPATEASLVDSLAIGLAERYLKSGDVSSLDKALLLAQQTAGLCPDGHAERPMYFSNLANILSYRFGRFGEVADLEAAVGFAQQAVSLAHEAGQDRPRILSTFANILSYRFERFGEITDLEAAIGAVQQAALYTPEAHPDRPMYLKNLANMLSQRFRRLGRQTDLEAAVDAARQATVITPDGHPDRLGRL